MENHSKNKGVIDNLRPKAAFKAGLLTGLAVMFVIGFFILLGFMLSDKVDTNGGNKNSNTNANTNVVDNGANNNLPSQDIVLRPVDENKDWISGNPDGDITIVEFSDVDCPFCTRFHEAMNQVVSDNSNVRWVYRHFPLTGLHPEAMKKAEAVECVGELGGNDKVWSFLDSLFAGSETLANIGDVAAGVGVDKNKFQECLDSGKYTSKVNESASQAQKAGAKGTPYSVIISGDKTTAIPGALPAESIQAMLDSLQ
ncbi:thioredoxin domain-containing protein [Candidatus Parcubacteria bacterium]|jgi:protein-disulfide isomerase|nr:thioredoxin domain-containing protein [Candidatus Parcubacteria bacterium]MBT7229001.1 thioredoxin domain-containing protein [Candidatus Parcubacteria bacterium]